MIGGAHHTCAHPDPSATMSSSSPESIQNLQTECHYLTSALNRINNKKDPEEYKFLQDKLAYAEEQLNAALAAADAAADMNDNAVEQQSAPDDYSFDEKHSKMAEYYAATNTYRQQLQHGARNYGLKLNRNSLSGSNNNDDDLSDSDDSSVGSANRHVRRNYRTTLLVNKSRDFLAKNKKKMNDLKIIEATSSTNTLSVFWIKIIALIVLFIIILSASIASSKRSSSRFSDIIGIGGSSGKNNNNGEACAILSITLRTDRFGNETSWDITTNEPIESSSLSRPLQYTETKVMSGGPYKYGKYTSTQGYTEQIYESICLPVGKYKFVLHDKMGDGLCCQYGRGQYGIIIRDSARTVRPMKDGLFLGKEEITSFEITIDDVGVLGADSTTTSGSEYVNDSNTDDNLVGLGLDDGLDGGFGDDMLNLYDDDDGLINAMETHSDDAVDPLLYYNIEHMDKDTNGKVTLEEYKTGIEEISQHCSTVNVQTHTGRAECEKFCGEDHYCCFGGSYDCSQDPSYACAAFAPCEILFTTSTSTNELETAISNAAYGDPAYGETSASLTPLTTQEKALIEESVYQYCSPGVAGLGMGKCQEICHEHLCCFDRNFGVGIHCKSSYNGLCPTYAGCEILVSTSATWNTELTDPNESSNNSEVMDENENVIPPVSEDQNQSQNTNDDGILPPSKQPLTLEEKLQMQDQVDQACSDYSINSGNGQCNSLCVAHMCCFDTSQHTCRDYDPLCPFYSSCEKLMFVIGSNPHEDFDPTLEEGYVGNRKSLRG